LTTDISREEAALSRSERKTLGAFFTPSHAADFMVRQYGLHTAWRKGARILDPTAGNGALLEAVIRVTLEEGETVTDTMLSRLKGIEQEEAFLKDFPRNIHSRYGLELPENLITRGDFLTEQEDRTADIIFGNPPWLNFTELPEDQKHRIKPFFLQYRLAGSPRDLLLGNSRIDLAALIIIKALQDHLTAGGKGYFFAPLSLVLNEGAHNTFRSGRLKEDHFAIREVWDYAGHEIFPGVTTRCGFLHLERDSRTAFPLPYHRLNGQRSWEHLNAEAVAGEGSAFMTCRPGDRAELPEIVIPGESRPRQGINTGGRNSLFIFRTCIPRKNGLVELGNRERTVLLPENLVYPLISSSQFRDGKEPERFIFLPYSETGAPLTEGELEGYPAAKAYLEEHRESLMNRKGTMLRGWLRRGYYWALLGVGPYTFFPWKIVWEAYGRREFRPRLLHSRNGKVWIPNQALQAYTAFRTRKEAEKVLTGLKNPEINRILRSQNMEGTCNWAQPGRIKVFMKIC